MAKIKVRDLAIFDAVVLNGSIQGAAEAIGLTQSAVSRVIQRLELDLGHTLLDRSQRPVRLTKDGERAIAHARHVLTALDRMEDAFQGTEVPEGDFRLGLPHALTAILLDADHMLGLRAFPQLRASFISGWSDDLLKKLSERRLDAAITLAQTERVPTETPVLATSAIHVVCAAQHADEAMVLAKANEIGWALNPSGCGYRRALLTALEQSGQPPNIVLETNSLELQLEFARAGRAVTLAPGFLRDLSQSAHDLCFVRARDFTASVSVLFHRAEHATSFENVYGEIEEEVRACLHKIP